MSISPKFCPSYFRTVETILVFDPSGKIFISISFWYLLSAREADGYHLQPWDGPRYCWNPNKFCGTPIIWSVLMEMNGRWWSIDQLPVGAVKLNKSKCVALSSKFQKCQQYNIQFYNEYCSLSHCLQPS